LEHCECFPRGFNVLAQERRRWNPCKDVMDVMDVMNPIHTANNFGCIPEKELAKTHSHISFL
jgi:hypothetical protein